MIGKLRDTLPPKGLPRRDGRCRPRSHMQPHGCGGRGTGDGAGVGRAGERAHRLGPMPTRSPWTCVLWDVDGTVVDASDGILRRLTIALEHFGKLPPTRAELV